jgi:hypothetical protein
MADFARTQNFDSDFDLDENFSYDQETSVLISEIDLFGDNTPSGPIYLGSAGQSVKYVGLRLETELYVGSGNLWP